ncbi:MAG: trigger factor [Rubrobacteraceae bacterium]
MTANIEKLEDNKVRLEVEVTPEQVREGVEAKVRELRKQVRIPGFRPGKAPRRMIENHVGRDYVYMEALQDELPGWYSQAVVDADLRPIDRPEIHFDDPLDEKTGFKFSATVEVRPRATLGEYKGLEVPRREVEADEEQVESQLEELRSQFATLAAVEDRPAQEGDFVIMDFKGEKMTGGELPGGDAEDYMLEIGKGELLEDFENNLVGMNSGERKQFGVTFPMDYEEESLHGQSALFRVHLKEIKERDLPELDEEFAKEASEFETLDELKDAIREQLRQRLEQEAEGEFRNRVLDAVARNAAAEAPRVMVHDKADEMVRSFERNIEAQGMKAEQYYQIAGASREEFVERVHPEAEDTVKKELVLDAVVAAEGIEADEEELNHELGHVAEDTERSVEEVTETMRENGTYALLQEEMARVKALEFLAENAKAVPMPEEEDEVPGAGEEPEATVEAKVETKTQTTEGEKE